MSNLLSVSQAAKRLGIHKNTLLRNPDMLPVHLTAGGHRRYFESDINNYLGFKEDKNSIDNVVVIYNRVSTSSQRTTGDLDRQKLRNYEYCQSKCYTVLESIEEVSSGMNDNRKKLIRIIELAKQGKFSKLIVEHKDRLTRFNFNMFVTFFKQLGVEVICVEEILPKSFENELFEDIIGLLTSFSAKIYGKRCVMDRDLNASRNIEKFAVGYTGNKKTTVKKALVSSNKNQRNCLMGSNLTSNLKKC